MNKFIFLVAPWYKDLSRLYEDDQTNLMETSTEVVADHSDGARAMGTGLYNIRPPDEEREKQKELRPDSLPPITPSDGTTGNFYPLQSEYPHYLYFLNDCYYNQLSCSGLKMLF